MSLLIWEEVPGENAIATAAEGKSRKTGGKDYVTALAAVMARAATPRSSDEVLAQVPTVLATEFDAERCELWLWDEASRSAYLTHAAGEPGHHRHDYAPAGEGAIGKLADARKTVENVELAGFGSDEQEFARRTGLTRLCAYPLVARGRLVGLIAGYSRSEVEEELLRWWRLYAEVTGISVHEALAAQESRKAISQLSLLFEATRLLNSTLDLAELLDLILRIARKETQADRGTVFLVDKHQQELWSIVASGLEREEIRMPFGRGVAGRVAQTGETVNAEDAYKLPFHESSFDQKFHYRTKSLLCLPIRHHTGEIVGIIQLLNKTTGGPFTPEDEDFLTKLSGHMALALENARLHREAMEKQRLEKELALARSIQRGLLPQSPPVVPGFELAVLNEPCYAVGGDYYDFLSLGPQSLLLVVADVEGKGVSSALVMSNLQATLRALVMHLHSLEVLTLSLNEMMYHDSKSTKYLSIFLGLVDTRRNGLHYINAGHVPPLLVRGTSGEYKLLEEGGLVVGLFPQAEYQRGSVKLEPGDVLVCCTDGILEASNSREEEFGAERLAEAVARHRSKNAQEIVDAVLDDVNRFAVGGLHVDDKVLMVMKVMRDALPQTALASTVWSKPPG